MSPAFDPAFHEKDSLFWPIAEAARAFSSFAAWPPVADYGARLTHRAPVHFREQPPKPRRARRRGPIGARDLYDGRIIEDGWVPTRHASWHDFLNMLVWATFPAAKWQLHKRQHAAQSARLAGLGEAAPGRGLPNARTREQDTLALLDEGGIVVVCAAARVAELRAAFAERRSHDVRALLASGAARAVIFGHALYESLVLGRDVDGWGAAHVAAHDPALDGPLGDASNGAPGDAARGLVTFADRSLARTLAEESSFQTPDALARLDLALLRP